MRMILENEYGRIVLGGGERYGFNIISVEGLGLTSKSYTTVECAGKSGQETINVHVNSRIITIGGDVFGNGNKNVDKALKILSKDVWLTVLNGEKRRKIYTKIKEFEIYNKNAGYFGFVLQLEADNPYFSDTDETECFIFNRENKVTGLMTLPCVFTERTVGADVINKGAEKTYPKIIIYDVSGNGKSLEEKYLIVKNEDMQIKFEYETAEGEVLTLDFENRTATSNISGDITPYLALENYLSGFYLTEGENRIELVNETNREISVVCIYNNSYNECV